MDLESIPKSRSKSGKAELRELGYIVVPCLSGLKKPLYCPTALDFEDEWEVVQPDVVNDGN
jgi:hypothetical protein